MSGLSRHSSESWNLVVLVPFQKEWKFPLSLE